MSTRTVVTLGLAIVFSSCAGPEGPTTPSQSPRVGAAAEAVATPLKGDLSFLVTGQEWAGIPGVDRSTFGGRCSLPSDYVVTAIASGTLTHLGQLSPSTVSHCNQIQWTMVDGQPAPASATYSDGRWDVVAANGDVLKLTYGNGVVTVGGAGGTLHDEFAIVGGTGRFRNASGGGVDEGTFDAFTDPLLRIRMSGSIAY